MTNEQLAVLLMALVNDLRDAVDRAEMKYKEQDIDFDQHLFDELKTYMRTFTHFRNELKGCNP